MNGDEVLLCKVGLVALIIFGLTWSLRYQQLHRRSAITGDWFFIAWKEGYMIMQQSRQSSFFL